MAKRPVCEECGRAAEVQLQGPRVLCRRCAGLTGPGFLNWRSAYRSWGCVVCGQEAVTDVLRDDGLERPVCYEHVLPAWQLDVELARQVVAAAVASDPLVKWLRAALLRLADWMTRALES
jgi:DNA-directed RNA polymerase subunit RPC12/RpoP